ncbi:MAG: glycosyltransferase family 2 protein, partial [Bacteroidetes bacterium]|nr:glycosyltransferase family 2 protein [Bacteroidota bacterium]
MKVSIIIPTYNGAHKITTVLKALEQQTYYDFETIVVIDGSTDNTLDILNGLNPRLKEFSYQFQSNMGRAAVRNTGAKAAAGDLLIFFDDDMRPEPDCVEKHVNHHQQLAGTIAVGRAQEDKRLCQTDFHFYRAHLSEKWTQPLLLQQGPLPESIIYLT